MKRFYILFLFLFVFRLGSSQTNRIQVIAWNGVPSEFTNDTTYQQLKDAGVTINLSGFHTLNEAEKALDMAAKKGIKLIFNSPEMFGTPEKIAGKLKSHQGLAGYFLSDEPNAREFEDLKILQKRLNSVDNQSVAYINLFPSYANSKQLGTNTYKDYLDKFFKELDLKVYSFDFYPIYNGVIQAEWYGNLEMFSQHAKDKGARFWAFVKTTSFTDENEKINIEDMRLQTYTNLAYGAQGIQYFTYWTPEGNFFNGPLSRKGVKQSAYDKIRIISSEIKAVSPVFYNSTVDKVYHTEQFEGTTLFKNDFSELKLNSGKNLLISKIKNGKNRYIVFVNKDLTSVNQIKILSKQNFNIVGKNQKTTLFNKNTAKTFSIGKGDLLILKY